jgi:hypothetical protein
VGRYAFVSETAIKVLIVVCVELALLTVVFLLIRRRLRQMHENNPAYDEYRSVAAGLSWGDRWRINRAIANGRAVRDPRLAKATAARARYTQTTYERTLLKDLRFSPWWGALAIAVGLISIVRWWVTGGGTSSGIIYLLVGAFFLSPLYSRWIHGMYSRAQEAERANDALASAS